MKRHLYVEASWNSPRSEFTMGFVSKILPYTRKFKTPKNPCQPNVHSKIGGDAGRDRLKSRQQIDVPTHQIELQVFRKIHDGLQQKLVGRINPFKQVAS